MYYNKATISEPRKIQEQTKWIKTDQSQLPVEMCLCFLRDPLECSHEFEKRNTKVSCCSLIRSVCICKPGSRVKLVVVISSNSLFRVTNSA